MCITDDNNFCSLNACIYILIKLVVLVVGLLIMLKVDQTLKNQGVINYVSMLIIIMNLCTNTSLTNSKKYLNY